MDDTPRSSNLLTSPDRFTFLSDGRRRVDYVLAYELNRCVEDETASDDDDLLARYSLVPNFSKKEKRRRIFEDNLIRKGLELEHIAGKYCDKVGFVLVHVPFDLLCKHAEKLGIELPVRSDLRSNRAVVSGCYDSLMRKCSVFRFDEETNTLLDEPINQYHPFTIDDMECFVGSEDPENFFSSADRVFITHDLLGTIRYGRNARIGIDNALKKQIYCAAYPLHEYLDYENLRSGPCTTEEDPTLAQMKLFTPRQVLYWLWAKMRHFYKFQPLFLIKDYFGSKIALYFALVGFFTKFLIPCSIVGLFCFLYGLSTLKADIPSSEVCADKSILMCPICDYWCDFTTLNSSCSTAKCTPSSMDAIKNLIASSEEGVYVETSGNISRINLSFFLSYTYAYQLSYVFDNVLTIIFAIVMSIAATLFVEGWKRYCADTSWRLGLLDTGSHEEGIRLAYLLQSLRSSEIRNPLTSRREPVAIPICQRLPRLLASFITVIFFLCLISGAVIGTILYRIVLLQVLYRVDSMRSFAKIFTSVTTAVLNLAVILLMSYFYSYLALKLTEWEYPRTQSEFEKSYTVKVFLFQFINWYSSIFYVAFFKGSFSGLPGRRILGLRPEDCDPTGCMVELVISVAIIMLGKTVYNIAMEFFNPVFLTVFRGFTLRIPESRSRRIEKFRRQKQKEMVAEYAKVPSWEWDYALTPTYEQFLFDDYLDIVIQFGFVTLFVSAFPLAPLVALINNVLEGRLDAYKFVVSTRRPVPERAKGIGVWLPIIQAISNLAVLTNAFIIAFTSDFIPQMVYQYYNLSLTGYINSTLSVFEPSSLHPAGWTKWHDVSECWFRGHRKPPCSLSSLNCDDKYGVTHIWWEILAFRLGFVVVFALVVYTIKAFIAYIIPDMPSRVFIELQRQRSSSLAGLSSGTTP